MLPEGQQRARIQATFRLRKAFLAWLEAQEANAAILGQADARYLVQKWSKGDEQ